MARVSVAEAAGICGASREEIAATMGNDGELFAYTGADGKRRALADEDRRIAAGRAE